MGFAVQAWLCYRMFPTKKLWVRPSGMWLESGKCERTRRFRKKKQTRLRWVRSLVYSQSGVAYQRGVQARTPVKVNGQAGFPLSPSMQKTVRECLFVRSS